MAVFGIGANYDGNDVTEDFIKQGVACVGWSDVEAPALHSILKTLKIGDIIYIKSAPIGQGIRIKGVGVITDNALRQLSNLGTGISVNWVWQGNENIGSINDKYNVRNNTLYEEFNKGVQQYIIELLLK